MSTTMYRPQQPADKNAVPATPKTVTKKVTTISTLNSSAQKALNDAIAKANALGMVISSSGYEKEVDVTFVTYD